MILTAGIILFLVLAAAAIGTGVWEGRKKKISNPDKKGYTLIEILVVIGIIAILATFAFVFFGGATKSARDAKRLNDLDQLGRFLAFGCLVPAGGAGEYDLNELCPNTRPGIRSTPAAFPTISAIPKPAARRRLITNISSIAAITASSTPIWKTPRKRSRSRPSPPPPRPAVKAFSRHRPPAGTAATNISRFRIDGRRHIITKLFLILHF